MNQSYSFYSKNRRFALHTSKKEIHDLLIAWLLISIAFSIVNTASLFASTFVLETFLVMIVISAITVGIGFLLHELAHKIVAQQYRCWAEFRADMRMLIAAVLMSFLGFVFIAPGAVMIYGHITEKQNGIISLAGPLTNIIIAVLLLPLLFIQSSDTLWSQVIASGFIINAWLALFNMIPFGNFDGSKILRWNKIIYGVMVAFSIVLVAVYFMR